MKKSTLIVVLLALAFGFSVYYYEYRRAPSAKATDDTSQSVFHFQAEDVTGVTIVQSSQTVALSKNKDEWDITQPVTTRADQSAIGEIVNGMATARSTRTLSATPEQLHSFGLDKPGATLEIKLKSGEQHRLALGDTDFTGQSVYARTDDSKDVVLIPNTVRTGAQKSLDDLRDRSVLSFSTWDVSAFELKNPTGEIALAKKDADWQIRKPRELAADVTQVTSLLGQLSSTKMTKISSETADDLDRYGLTKPVASVQLHLANGQERALLIGSKSGDDYYARDTSRPMVFLVPASIYQKLDTKLFDLREKRILRAQLEDFTRVELRNKNQKLVCSVDAEGKWKVEEPTDLKGKEAQQWKIFTPLQNAVAKDIVDSPPPAVTALLAKAAVEIELRKKGGGTEKISISPASGDVVYVRTSDGPSLYKVAKQTLDDLEFKAADVVR